MPPVLIIWYVRSQDRTPEDLKFLLKLFFGGVTSCVLTLLITLCLVLFKIYIDPEGIDDLLMNIFVSFIFVGLIEEFSKFIFVYFIGYRKKKIKEFYDIIVRSSFVAIGFAAFENIFYVLGAEYSIAVGIGRAISAVPFHAGLGIMMGYYLGLARINKINHKQKLSHFYFILALLVPALFHGIYDGILFYLKATNSNYAIIFVLAIIILTVTFSYMLL